MIKKNSTCSLLACAAVAVLTAWSAAGVSVAAQTNRPVRPDLSGTWQLNRDLSEDAQEKLHSMSGGGEHAGRRGGHGPGSRGGGGRAEEETSAQLEPQNLILNAPTHFILTQDDQKVVLTEPDGHVRTLLTNDRTGKVDGRDVRTKWENNRLISEITVANGKITETYERLPPNAPQLIVTVRMAMQGRQASVRRVYRSSK